MKKGLKYGIIGLLTALTISVVAARRQASYQLYVSHDGVYFYLIGFGALSSGNLTPTSNGHAQCKVSDAGRSSYSLYYNNLPSESPFYPIYPAGTW